MNKLIRVLIVTVAATIAFSAFGSAAMAKEVSQRKYWVGLGGATVCNIPYTGQGFHAQAGTKYTVTLRAILGGDVHGKIRFLLEDGSWTDPAIPFTNTHSAVVPQRAVEAWVTVCHSTNEVSYSAAVVIPPVEITYRDGIE